MDQAGFGESPQPCSVTNILLNFQEAERALGAVDVFIGHSMGDGVGAWSVREAGFRPKLFIGVGAADKLGEHGPPLLLLFARFDEFRSLIPTWFRAQTNAQIVIPPWSGVRGVRGQTVHLPLSNLMRHFRPSSVKTILGRKTQNKAMYGDLCGDPCDPAMLALLVSKFLSKFLGHVELRNPKNEKGHPECGKKQLWTALSNVV